MSDAEELIQRQDVTALREWIARAVEAERLAEERLAHANQLQSDIEADQAGRMALRRRFGAREDETFGVFVERLALEPVALRARVAELEARLTDTATSVYAFHRCYLFGAERAYDDAIDCAAAEARDCGCAARIVKLIEETKEAAK